MQVYATRDFSKFAAGEGIDDQALCAAVARAESGLIDANLAGPIIKQRVARPGRGASRGYRTILVYQPEQLALFVHGFAKSSKASLSQAERNEYSEFGRTVVDMDPAFFDAATAKQKWRRVDCEQFQEDVP